MLNKRTIKNLQKYFIFPVACIALLVACGSDDQPADTSQVVAKVGDTEVTIHQLNLELSDSRLAAQANQKQVQRAMLERLVDRTLLVNKALEKELHRNPTTMQAIERSKQQVLAQAYLRTLGAGSSPTDVEMKRFFDDRSELFAKRRVYHLQLLTFDASSDHDQLKKQFDKAKKFTDFTDWVQAEKIRARPKVVTQGAETVNSAVLTAIKNLPAGTGAFVKGKSSAIAVWIVSAKQAPLTFEQAKSFIKKHLETKKRNEQVDREIKRLRAATQIEYTGAFADQAEPSSEKNEPPENVEDTSDFVDKGISGLKAN